MSLLATPQVWFKQLTDDSSPKMLSRGACKRLLSTSKQLQPKTWGMAIDIDGVVVRGPNLIKGSDKAIALLKEHRVPHIFLTNGGGVTEAKKTEQLNTLTNCGGVSEQQMLLSHTPMRSLAEKFRGKRVVIVGGKETVAAARSYGFDVDGGMAVTCTQLAAGLPLLPDGLRTHQHPINQNISGAPRIEAVLIFFEPLDWSLELQVLCDVIAGGVPLGSGTEQAVEVYASNPDFLWKAEYDEPRFGQGAFTECLGALWRRLSGGSELKVEYYGKPTPRQYEAAEEMLRRQEAGHHLKLFYGIGDNPAADVRGANGAGQHWRSILVCSGVYSGGVDSNDSVDPAWRVEEDLLTAVQRLLEADVE